MSKLKKILIFIAALVILIAGAFAWFMMTLFADDDMSAAPAYYPYKSIQAKEHYLDYYDNRARVWPVPVDTLTVKTGYGNTFVRVSGPADAPPLVLLPSTSATSLLWIPNISGLSQYFRIYAVDNIYDFGRSKNTRSITTSADMTSWLDELFTALDLGDSLFLAGLSFGGWLTSQYSLAHPERLQKTVWLAPAATIFNFPAEWAWRGILSALPHRWFMEKYMIEWLFEDLLGQDTEYSRKIINELVDDALMGLKSYKFRMPVTPTVLSDDELRQVTVPTLLIVGENEKLYDADSAVFRIISLAPRIKTVIINGAGHDLTIVKSDQVNDTIIDFLLADK